MNILFSSGTTGEPKAIPWTQTTPLKCAADAHFHVNIQPGDVLVWPTNLGWMMGPWVIFGSLMNRAAMGLYYGAPTGREFGQFVQAAGTTALGVVPSLVRNWRNTGCMKGLDWSAIKVFSSTGECSSADDMRWLMQTAGGRPVIEYCGGTEIGGAYISSTLAKPNVAGTFNTPTLGLDVVILDEEGRPADIGELFVVPPSIGLSNSLLNKDHYEIYFAGAPRGPHGEILRRHGDQMERLPGGYWRAHGRADDTMNLGGIKVSSAEIEQTLRALPGIVETAAIAVSPGGGPSQLVIYAVCSVAQSLDKKELLAAMQSAIKRDLNPLFKIHDLVLVETLPRTASNKIMRRELRARYAAAP
jgi:acetyl-CoA synthetase